MKLGVIIVTYNRLELLKEAINACVNQTYPFSEILIVNNASNDGTTEYLSKLNNKNTTIINLEENTGGAGGFSVGVNYYIDKKIDYLLFIDDDAILDINYNKNIFDFVSKNYDNSIIGYSGCVKTDNNIIYDHRRYLRKNFKQVDSQEQDYLKDYFDYELSTFCGLFLSMKIVRKIGLPRSDFFIWFDDTEYCLRANKYGKIRNINSSYLNHKTKINTSTGYNWKSYYGIRNNYIILKEYYSRLNLLKYIFKCRLYIYGGLFISLFKNSKYYKTVSSIYKDSIHDARKNIMGKNEKYTYKFKLER